MMAVEEQTFRNFERVVRRVDPRCRLLRAWRLTGGVSATVTALEIEYPDGRSSRLLVRQHGHRDLAANAEIARDEFRLLQLLRSRGLPTPVPYHVDDSCTIFPTPYIVTGYIEGSTEVDRTILPEAIRQMAAHLARVHEIDNAKADLSFLPEHGSGFGRRPARLDDSLSEGRIRETLEALWPLPGHNKAVLLHGDYWPGNLLWREGTLVGIVDWEDARVGDPLADLANSRLEILWAFGPDAMRDFTREYHALTAVDLRNLAYWDLCAALRPASRLSEWAGDAQVEQRMREGHRLFIDSAFERVTSQGVPREG